MNYDNNILGAIIFLNSLNIGLYRHGNISDNELLKIYDKEKHEIGAAFIKDDVVHIYAIFCENQIHASYNINKIVNGTYDIIFNIKGLIGLLNGHYFVQVLPDKRKVSFQGDISLYEDNEKIIDFSLFKNGIFNLILTKKRKHNELLYKPFDNKDGYITHKIFEYDEDEINPEENLRKKKYDMYYSVTQINDSGISKYLGFKGIIENNLETSQESEVYGVRGGYSEHLIDIGNIINKVDPSVRKTIENFRELLNYGKYGLFDHLMGIAFASYCDDEAFYALFGFKKPHIVFQNGAKSLEELVFNTIRVSLSEYSLEREKK